MNLALIKSLDSFLYQPITQQTLEQIKVTVLNQILARFPECDRSVPHLIWKKDADDRWLLKPISDQAKALIEEGITLW
jgi:hypothetical protein